MKNLVIKLFFILSLAVYAQNDSLKTSAYLKILKPSSPESSEYTIEYNSPAGEDNMLRISSNGKFGYINLNREIIAKPIYMGITPFRNGYATLATEKGWGAINTKGEFIIPIMYSQLFSFNEDNTALAKLNGKFGRIDNKNKIAIPFLYDKVGQFEDGFAVVSLDNKSGVVDYYGRLVIPLIYDEILGPLKGQFKAVLNNSTIFLDYNGKEVADDGRWNY